MKNFSSLLSFGLILVSISLSNCGKDDDKTPTPTKTELLTTASWKFSTATLNGSDASGFLQACQKDNIYTFAVANTGTIDEGGSKCNGSDPQTNPFTWSFLSNETILHISTVLFTGGSNDFTLVSLSSTQLVVSQNYPPYGTIVVTFIH